VGAVFIILFVSGLACSFPTLAKHFPGLRLSPRFFFAVRHFGTGVLIATAFVHLLPTAFISLGNPCLSPFWNEDYPAMPGAIALAGIFFVVIIEMIFHPGRHHPPHLHQIPPPTQLQTNAISMPMMRPIGGRTTSIGRSLSANQAITEAEQQSKDSSQVQTTPPTSLAEEQKLRKDRLQCVLLEVGILFHSVFIGMALSVSTGSDFVVLLIAITFHREFIASHSKPQPHTPQKPLKDLLSDHELRRSTGHARQFNHGSWLLRMVARKSNPPRTNTAYRNIH
jgi:zinc transporter ZupT